MLSLYKNYILAGLFIVYSLGVWHVAGTYKEAKYIKENLAQANKVIELTEKNQEIIAGIDKKLQEGFAKIKPQVTTINKEIQREIIENRIYSECKSTPDLVQQFEDKLDLYSQ